MGDFPVFSQQLVTLLKSPKTDQVLEVSGRLSYQTCTQISWTSKQFGRLKIAVI
jgi:hypothetical protein